MGGGGVKGGGGKQSSHGKRRMDRRGTVSPAKGAAPSPF